ncbi:MULTISPECIES: tetratricopeptide repeat protein [unclassified Saccharothrix]|uniref:tetratricopeptide repeat protein n=1 Tax=unclassified Saccharothrix TaxID=2593673 RepID=UPI00307E518C
MACPWPWRWPQACSGPTRRCPPPGSRPGAAATAAERALDHAFRLSYEHLDPDLRLVFRRLALHPGADADVCSVGALAGVDVGSAERALAALVRANLVEQHRPGRFRLHDLLRALAVDLVARHDGDGARRVAMIRLIDHYVDRTIAAQNATSPRKWRRDPAATTPEFVDETHAYAWLETECRTIVAVVRRAADLGAHAQVVRLALASAESLARSPGLAAEASAVLGHALRAARVDRDRAAVLHRLAILARNAGDLEAARAHCDRSLELSRAAGDRRGQAFVLDLLGTLDHLEGRDTEALEHHREALDLARGAGDRACEDDILHNLGKLCLERLGDPSGALDYFGQSLEIRRGLADRRGLVSTLNAMGATYAALNDPASAGQSFEEALAVSRDIGDRLSELDTLANLGRYRAAHGALDAALAEFDRARDIAVELGDVRRELRLRFDVAGAMHAAGRLKGAEEHYRSVLDLAVERDDTAVQEIAYRALGKLYFDLADRQTRSP